MNVCFVTNMYPERPGSYYGIFVKELQHSLEKRGHTISVAFTDGRQRIGRYLTDIPRISRAMHRQRFDVIHTHHSYSTIQARIARTISGSGAIPVVFSIHEGEMFAPSSHRAPQRRLLKRIGGDVRSKRFACRGVDALVAVNQRLLDAVGRRGISAVIPPGVDLELFRPLDTDDCRRQIGLASDRPVVLFPAKPTHAKGFDLVQEAQRLSRHRWELVVGGSIQRDDMPVYMGASDVVVAPSRFEASPMVVKEALAVNRPVVTTDVGDVRELFGDLASVHVCRASAVEIAGAIDQGLEAGAGATVGRPRIEALGLDLETVARRYESIYEAVCSGDR